jgi:alanine-glyoxylate transaminase/serine-glyoxylate transaminase/serine-pyruvate transaminase
MTATKKGLAPSNSRASSRLNLFSRHLDPRFLELNTPFSTERSAHLEDESGNIIRKKKEEQSKEVDIPKEEKKEAPVEEAKTMSSQPPHSTLLIPGPIEFDDAVLQSMSHFRYAYSTSNEPNDAELTYDLLVNRTSASRL